MKSRSDNIGPTRARVTMVRILAAIVVGVLIADRIAFPLWSVAVGFVVMVAAAWAFRREAVGDIYILAAASLAAMTTTTLSAWQGTLPYAGQMAEVEIEQITSRGEEFTSARGRLLRYGDEVADNICGAKVRLMLHNDIGAKPCEHLTGRFSIKRLSRTSEQSYERYMARLDYQATLFIRAENILSRNVPALSFGERLRAKATARIEQLALTPRVAALAKGVTTGDRGAIDRAMRQQYTLCGAAHLLAVSGLHVGFLFFMVNILLGVVALARRGPIIRWIVATAAIWLYAAMTGFSPSVVRAAVMFTILQTTMTWGRGGGSLNGLAMAACVMLLWQGRWLYDAGFMLSFIAVGAIVVWGVKLSQVSLRRNDAIAEARASVERLNRMRSRWGWLQRQMEWLGRRVWSAVVITVVATIATMPLVSNMFGVVTLWNIIVGPLMVWLCSVVVGATMLQIAFGAILPSSIVQTVIETAGGAMNSIAEWCAESDILIFEVELSTETCFMIYGIAAIWIIYRREHNS